MATPDFVLELRKHVGHAHLWLPGCTVVVVRPLPGSGGMEAVLAGEAGAHEVEVLLVRRADNAQWTPVTGIVDPGEEPAAAALRETMEEAAVTARVHRLLGVEVVGPVTYGNGDVTTYLDTSFLAEWVEGEPWPADGKNTEAAFVRADALPAMNERFRRTVARALSGGIEATFRV